MQQNCKHTGEKNIIVVWGFANVEELAVKCDDCGKIINDLEKRKTLTFLQFFKSEVVPMILSIAVLVFILTVLLSLYLQHNLQETITNIKQP